MTDGSADPGAPAQLEVARLRVELGSATEQVRVLVGQLKAAVEATRFGAAVPVIANEVVVSTNQELLAINDELRVLNADLIKASVAVRLSGEFTSAIVETVRYPLLVLTANLRVESANQAFLDAFGVDRQETIGRLVYNLGNGQWDIPELQRLLEDILPNNSAFDDFEVTHDFGAIGSRTILLNARRLLSNDEWSGMIVLALDDITERTRISNDLKDTSIEQLRSNAELDQFAAVASHDLQEPLRMMSNYIDLLQRRYGPLFDERAREYMGHVTNGAQRMSEMIKAILTYSRLGHEATGVTTIDSVVALEHAKASLRAKTESAGGTILSEAMPRVLANREQLTQLFQNLLSNALKFSSEKRPPIIHVTAIEAKHEWVFAVTDNGVGMEPSSFGKIFELFHRAHLDRGVQGCGIGLATCKKIVEHHKGRIWVESKPDVGSTFFFSLPR